MFRQWFRKQQDPQKALPPIRYDSEAAFITIEAVKSALEENDIAKIVKLFSLFEARDLKIAEGIEKRQNALATIKPAIEAGEAERRIIDAMFDRVDVSDYLYAISDAVYYGFSMVELHYEMHEGMLLPVRITHHEPTLLRRDPKKGFYLPGKEERRHYIDALSPRLYLYNHTKSDAHLHTKALAYKLLYYALLKHVTIGFNVQYFDSLSVPPLIVKSSQLSDEEHLQALQSALMALKSNSYGIFPDTIDLDSLKVGSQADFQKLIDYFDALIAQYLVGATSVGDGSAGSMALAKIQQERFSEKIAFDAARAARGLKEIVTQTLALNLARFSPPKITLPVPNFTDAEQFATVVEKLGNGGYDVDTGDISERLGITVTKRADISAPATPQKEENARQEHLARSKPLDAVQARIDTDDIKQAEAALVRRVERALSEANSYEEAYAMLHQDPGTDIDAMEELLHRYIANAQLMGMSDDI